MPNLYARASARGFPVYDLGAQSGQGALPDSTQPGSSQAGLPDAAWTDPNLDPGSVPAVLAAPEEFISGGLWGLSGSVNPDRTPRTHAAPFADPTLPIGEYYAEADAAHGADFGGPAERNNVPSFRRFSFDRVTADDGSNSALQPLQGQIRLMGGYDGVQGYGGGGDGPRGTNSDMPLTTDQQFYPGTLYDAFVSASEVTSEDVAALQFIPAAPELGPWLGGGFEAPTSTVLAQDAVTADTPALGQPVPQPAQGAPAYATSFWG